MDRKFWNSVTTYGLYLAIISILYVLITNLLAANNLKVVGGILWVVKLCATIYLLFTAMKNFAKANFTNGVSSNTDPLEEKTPFNYGKLFRFGFFISLCSGIILTVYLFIDYQWIHPETIENMIDVGMERMSQMGMQGQFDRNAMAKTLQFLPLTSLIWCTFLGLIYSAIIVKRLQPKEMEF